MEHYERITFSRSEAASALRCSEATIDRMIRAGQLRSTQIGKRRVVIRREEINRLLTEGSHVPQTRRREGEST